MKNRKLLIRMTLMAVFSALSSIFYFVPTFPLPIFPNFLKIQFSTLPAVIAGMTMGPVEGVVILIVKTIIKIPTSSTSGVGELGDLLIGLFTVLATSLIYLVLKKKIFEKKPLIACLISLTFGFIIWIGTALIINAVILVPFYKSAFGFDAIIGKCSNVIPGINETNFMRYYLLAAVLPFNAILAGIVMIVTFLVFNPLALVFKTFVKEN